MFSDDDDQLPVELSRSVFQSLRGRGVLEQIRERCGGVSWDAARCVVLFADTPSREQAVQTLMDQLDDPDQVARMAKEAGERRPKRSAARAARKEEKKKRCANTAANDRGQAARLGL
eukprot:gene51585-20705_t